VKKPAVALMGALALVQLMIKQGSAAPADIIGTNLSQALKEGWIVFAALIGTLGSFFSGSTTISNLTFGGIQKIAAETIGTSFTSMLALQAVGASAGNGVCLNNIISACTVVGLNISEGKIIAQTFKPVLGVCLLATAVMLAFFFRF
jgi:lactate permease